MVVSERKKTGQHAPEQPHLSPSAGVGTWLIAALTVVVATILLYLAVPACGVRVFSSTILFPWCEPRLAAIDVLEAENQRKRALENQIHDAELALFDPALCGPPVEASVAPEPELPPVEQEEQVPIEQAELCEPDEVLQPPEEVALVVDGSGSMRFAADIPPALLQEYADARNDLKVAQRAIQRGGDFTSIMRAAEADSRVQNIERRMERVRGASRADVARDILRRTVQDAPEGLPIDLTMFSDCNRITSQSYDAESRDALLSRLSRLRPQNGTPLARSLEVAASNLEGGDDPNNPVTMVVISDGDDSCDGDPCAVARAIKARKPGVIINVLDLSQTDEVRCIADATGGRFQRGTGNTEELFEMMKEAAGYSGAGQCRPAVEN